jgi:tetratricopeptide (TPR) repeat protein
MRKILICFILIATARAAWAVDFGTVVRQCNSPVYDQKLMRACGMLATQAQLDPTNRAAAYDLRARAYLALGQFDYAILDTTQALELVDKPRDPGIRGTGQFQLRTHALAIRSAAFAKSGQADKAMADRTTVLAQLSEMVERYSSAEGYAEMAFVKHVLGEEAEALEAAEKAVAWGPTDPGALSIRAEIHEALGHKDAAIEDYRASLKYGMLEDSTGAGKGIQTAQVGLARLGAKP